MIHGVTSTLTFSTHSCSLPYSPPWRTSFSANGR
jgi:hypothetical protein